MLLQTRRGTRHRSDSKRLNLGESGGDPSLQANRQTRLHFVGVGGIGMSGIAEVLHNQGYQVTGSDVADGEATRRLSDLGVRVDLGHRPENVDGAQVVVTSSAIDPDNPEVVAARKNRIPVIPRAEMLGELMRGKIGVAVAGSHGKTTTTSMIATVFSVAKLDPTIVIGGRVDSFGGNAKLGEGDYVVAEADESDGSFLYLPASIGVITNIDNDHLDYFGSTKKIEEAFIEFVRKIPFYGLVAVFGEDDGVRRCLSQFQKPFRTYGFSQENDYSATGIKALESGHLFSVFFRGENLGEFELRVPGRHNILNALAAIVICHFLGVPAQEIKKGLAHYSGVRRRFEVIWKSFDSSTLLVDDYAHHPTEIVATLSTARTFWKSRIVALFQPHRFSRTIHCKDGFLSAFQQADVVLVTDIYPAGEKPLEGVSSENLVEEMNRTSGTEKFRYAGNLENCSRQVMKLFQTGDLVITMGAGSITRLSAPLAKEMAKKING